RLRRVREQVGGFLHHIETFQQQAATRRAGSPCAAEIRLMSLVLASVLLEILDEFQAANNEGKSSPYMTLYRVVPKGLQIIFLSGSISVNTLNFIKTILGHPVNNMSGKFSKKS